MMKNKPIKEGFKFLASSCLASGFIFPFVPGSRLENNKINDVLNSMENVLPGIDAREKMDGNNYILEVDNYFILVIAIGRSDFKGRVLVLLRL